MTKEELDALIDKTVDEKVAAVKAAQPTEPPAPPAPEPPTEPSFTQAQIDAAIQAATEGAIKATASKFEGLLVASRRPPAPAPAVIRPNSAWAEAMPLTWAVKAARETGDSIFFNLSRGAQELEYDGTLAAKAAFKAMATTVGSAIGEHFVPTIQTNIVVEALYQQVITRRLPGVTIFPMPGLVVAAPTIGAFTAGWTAENATATAAGDATTGQKTMTAKNLTALATVSNQLLTDSQPAVEQYIRRGLAAAMGATHDDGAFYGAGGNAPTGITSTSGVTSTALSTDDIITGVVKAIGRMAVNKLTPSPINTAIIMRPEVVTKANVTRVGSTGDFINAATVQQGLMGNTLEDRLSSRIGYPVFMTTVIPTVSSASSILVLHCPDFIVGDRQELEIAASNVAGNAFAYNQTLIRAIMRVDFLLLRAASLEIITGVAH